MHNLRVESEGPECWSTKWARQATLAADGSSRASCAVATRQKGPSNPTWLRHHRMPRRPFRYCQDNAASLVTQHGLLLSDQEVVCVSWRPRFFPGPLTSRLRETHYLREAPGRLGHSSSRVAKCNLFPVSHRQFSEFRGETSSPAARGPATQSANSPPTLAAPRSVRSRLRAPAWVDHRCFCRPSSRKEEKCLTVTKTGNGGVAVREKS